MTKSKDFYPDFNQFYTKAVKPHKEDNPDYFRLDGRTSGSSRKVFGYFIHQDLKWKVDEDTHFDKLKIAFEILSKGEDPFINSPTTNGKRRCLLVKGEPKEKKMLYIYLVSSI